MLAHHRVRDAISPIERLRELPKRKRKDKNLAIESRDASHVESGEVVVPLPQQAVQISNAQKLPRGAIKRVNIGQSFAEYDPSLSDLSIYVHTLALASAQDANSGRIFFVGRRGTGKTAIRKYCSENDEHTRVIIPEIFSPSSTLHEIELLTNFKQRPFRSLVSAFRRALQVELLNMWFQTRPGHGGVSPVVTNEIESYGSLDFDMRSFDLISKISGVLTDSDDKEWMRENKIAKAISDEMNGSMFRGAGKFTLLVDSIDDYWEGTDEGLIYLTAFMHACLETSMQIPWVRTILFLRENIFERVRALDSESSRVETAVVDMEWSDEKLLELVERRLNKSLTAKFALGGATWRAFFEMPEEAWSSVMEYCQKRPRDVLIYVNNAIEAAQSANHEQIYIEDVEQARRRFSDNRFKDLGDEYAENYPQISVLLSRFYGLGNSFTIPGIESFIRKLFKDADVVKACGSWIYSYSSPEKFVRMLYEIGFVGIRLAGKPPKFRALGPRDTSPPPVSNLTDIVIHKCYWDSLDLQNVLVRELPEDEDFGRIGVIEDGGYRF